VTKDPVIHLWNRIESVMVRRAHHEIDVSCVLALIGSSQRL